MTNPTVELTLTDQVAAGGDTIGRLADGRVVFVSGGLPGEHVQVAIREDRRDWARGDAVEIVSPSPHRVEPPCPWVAAGCGGCQWQHVSPSAQLALKQSVVADALNRIGGVRHEVRFLAGVAVPASGYRTTAHLAVTPSGAPAYRPRRSHDLIEVEHCLVVHPLLRQLIDECRFPGSRRATLRVGAASGERLALLDRAPRSGSSRRVRVPDDCAVVTGRDTGVVHEDVGGRRWRISARSFFQAGPQSAEVLVAATETAAGDAVGGATIDAYAGVGLLGGALVGRHGGRLVAIESHPAAAADAAVNLADLDAEVVRAEVAAWSEGSAGSGRGAAARPRADLVVADPARPGLGRPGVAALACVGAPRLVLVSCDPASMARDVALLDTAGYSLSSVQVLDLFPHTTHVETVSRLDRR